MQLYSQRSESSKGEERIPKVPTLGSLRSVLPKQRGNAITNETDQKATDDAGGLEILYVGMRSLRSQRERLVSAKVADKNLTLKIDTGA